MTADELRRMAFAMPLLNPSFPMGPYCFVGREYLVITYRTDPEALRSVVPAPLRFDVPMVRYEFIRMPDSTGFGNYTESGQVIPVRLGEERGGYVHAMYLDDDAPIAAGRELWGFPKKLAQPLLRVERDALVGTLDVGPVRVATGTRGLSITSCPKMPCARRSPSPASCSRLFPTWTVRRASAS
jgi:acetoacetate decarboxylase